ncbi:MAG: SDR family NAD(P)-dependent oxidoreductase, partial [Nocardioidaceae bacterium]
MTDPGTDPAEPRVVVVTGGSSGIGRATAHRLAGAGERLVLAARSEQALEATRQECVARGAAGCLVVPTDIGDRADVERLFATAVDAFGRVDAVVQAAGVVAYGTFTDVPPEVFDAVVRTNLTGTANVARCALRQFGEQEHGSLVVVGSVLGKIATPLMSPYGTSKWAVHGLVRALQIEARRTPGIHVSLVSPGSVDTPIYDQAASYSGHAGHPPPPVGRPERSARTIVAALD